MLYIGIIWHQSHINRWHIINTIHLNCLYKQGRCEREGEISWESWDCLCKQWVGPCQTIINYFFFLYPRTILETSGTVIIRLRILLASSQRWDCSFASTSFLSSHVEFVWTRHQQSYSSPYTPRFFFPSFSFELTFLLLSVYLLSFQLVFDICFLCASCVLYSCWWYSRLPSPSSLCIKHWFSPTSSSITSLYQAFSCPILNLAVGAQLPKSYSNHPCQSHSRNYLASATLDFTWTYQNSLMLTSTHPSLLLLLRHPRSTHVIDPHRWHRWRLLVCPLPRPIGLLRVPCPYHCRHSLRQVAHFPPRWRNGLHIGLPPSHRIMRQMALLDGTLDSALHCIMLEVMQWVWKARWQRNVGCCVQIGRLRVWKRRIRRLAMARIRLSVSWCLPCRSCQNHGVTVTRK